MCYVPGPSQMEMMDEIARELHGEGLPESDEVETPEDLAGGSSPAFLNDDSDVETELLADDGDAAGPK